MVRPLAVIVAAILMSRPELTAPDVAPWAKVLQAEARARGFDPLTAVAIVHTESGWHPERISSNGEDYGLGQLRARFIGACRKDDDPLEHPGDACSAEKRSLLVAEDNLRRMAEIIGDMRKLCRDRAHDDSLPRWLASYQGRNFPKQKKWCVPGKQTWAVIQYRNKLASEAPRAAAAAAKKH